MFSRRQKGQSTVEYMLVISVIVIAIVGAAWEFVPWFNQAMEGLGDGAETVYTKGTITSP